MCAAVEVQLLKIRADFSWVSLELSLQYHEQVLLPESDGVVSAPLPGGVPTALSETRSTVIVPATSSLTTLVASFAVDQNTIQ